MDEDALERAGQRSLSALVDISNYVMLELGRPSHVFDLDKIQGDLSVRWAREGETLELLNGQTVTLDSARRGGGRRHRRKPGRHHGRRSTSVTLDTQNIYLEAAFWWPQSLAGRARRTSSVRKPAIAANAAWTTPRFPSTSSSSRA